VHRSHGNVPLHVQVSLDPAIDHDKFRVYSGLGNQLGPVVAFGAAGVIDGLAAAYPKTVVRLMDLTLKDQPTKDEREEIRWLQFAISQGEELVMRSGVLGIKEACFRVAGFRNLEGGRLPLKGKLPEGAWEMAQGLFLRELDGVEASL
jgi:2-keto-3-deoxy-L-rhamnonate aldolase